MFNLFGDHEVATYCLWSSAGVDGEVYVAIMLSAYRSTKPKVCRQDSTYASGKLLTSVILVTLEWGSIWKHNEDAGQFNY